MGVGSSEAGSVLSFAASIFAYGSGWASYSADYTCYQPVTISRTKVFFSTFCGLVFPLLFTQMLGATVMLVMCYLESTLD
jgi:purine-cytosine permease-like protein